MKIDLGFACLKCGKPVNGTGINLNVSFGGKLTTRKTFQGTWWPCKEHGDLELKVTLRKRNEI